MQNFQYSSGSMNSWQGGTPRSNNNMSMNLGSRGRSMYQDEDNYPMNDNDFDNYGNTPNRNSRGRYNQMEDDGYQNNMYENNGDAYMPPMDQNMGRSSMMNSRFRNNQYDFNNGSQRSYYRREEEDMNMPPPQDHPMNDMYGWRNQGQGDRYDNFNDNVGGNMRRPRNFRPAVTRKLAPQSRMKFKRNFRQKPNIVKNVNKLKKTRTKKRQPNDAKASTEKKEVKAEVKKETEQNSKMESDATDEKKETQDQAETNGNKSQLQVTIQQGQSGHSVKLEDDNIHVRCQVCKTAHQSVESFRDHLKTTNHVISVEKLIKKYVFAAGKLCEQLKLSNKAKIKTKRGVHCSLCGVKHTNTHLHRWSLQHQASVYYEHFQKAGKTDISLDQLLVIESVGVKDISELADNEDAVKNGDAEAGENNTENSEAKTENGAAENGNTEVKDKDIKRVAKENGQQTDMDALNSDMDEVTASKAEPIGQDNISDTSGFFCKLCKVFFVSKTNADILHCKSKKHREKYQKVQEVLKLKAERKAKLEEQKKEKLENDTATKEGEADKDPKSEDDPKKENETTEAEENALLAGDDKDSEMVDSNESKLLADEAH